MKELSIEEKAERYDEAIKVATDIKAGTATYIKDGTLVIDAIFPELAESEDESIRKALIKYFTLSDEHAYNEACGVSYRDIVAWLEKLQIEKLPFEMKTPEESLGIDSDTYSKVVDELIYGEPKQEWSEEDERMYRGLHNLIYSTPYCDSRKELSDWLKSIKDRYAWKPSDAQMASITCAVRKMKESACYDSELVSLFNDLKKLKEE